MPIQLKGRSLLTLMDFTKEEILYLLDLSADLKTKKRLGIPGHALTGKNLVILFEKTSTRTRCAFEVAMLDEGGHVTYLDSSGSQMNKKESLEDTARVLGRFYDGIEYRGYGQTVVEKLAQYSGVPVYNGLTNTDHPTQILADLLTMREHFGTLENKKVVFVGDTRNNMVYAWMYGCAKMGMTFVGLGPKALRPEQSVLDRVSAVAQKSGASITFTDDPAQVKDADVVYTDIWVSMGEEDQMAERCKLLSPYKVTMELFESLTAPEPIFMHCLPAYHDFETDTARKAQEQGLDIREVSDRLFRSPYSVVFDEAENRMHTIKAVLAATL